MVAGMVASLIFLGVLMTLAVCWKNGAKGNLFVLKFTSVCYLLFYLCQKEQHMRVRVQNRVCSTK